MCVAKMLGGWGGGGSKATIIQLSRPQIPIKLETKEKPRGQRKLSIIGVEVREAVQEEKEEQYRFLNLPYS